MMISDHPLGYCHLVAGNWLLSQEADLTLLHYNPIEICWVGILCSINNGFSLSHSQAGKLFVIYHLNILTKFILFSYLIILLARKHLMMARGTPLSYTMSSLIKQVK